MKPLVPMRAASFRPVRAEDLGAFLAKPNCDFELKLDGVRVIADLRGKKPSLTFRSGLPADFRELLEPLARHEGAVFDGEVVSFDETGRPSFAALTPRLHMRSNARMRARASGAFGSADGAARNDSVCYLLFDVLFLGGRDLTSLPLSARRSELEALAWDSPLVRVHPALEDGMALLQFAQQHGLEGIVRKERASTYVYGPRASDAWQKLKFEREDDFVVTGYVLDGSRLVSLEVASFRGPNLVMRARVGSGISEALAAILLRELAKDVVRDNVAEGELPPIDRHHERVYVTPRLVASVRYQEWTPDLHLRMPVFRGLRVDVAPLDCTADPRPL